MTYAPDLHAPLTPWTLEQCCEHIRRAYCIYSSQDVADRLGITVLTVQRHARSQRLGFRRARGWQFTEGDVEQIRQRLHKPNTHRIAA